MEAAGFDHPRLKAEAPYDLVFANILKGPLLDLAPDMAANLRTGGWAILSGLLVEQAKEVTEHYAHHGINLIHRDDIGEWSSLTLQKV